MGLLAALEPRLRTLLPVRLYAEAWSQTTPRTLERVIEHLRTLRYILQDYVPSFVARDPAIPGYNRFTWRTGALMFTDLAGFTSMVEAFADQGQAGSDQLLSLLNSYYAAMVEIVSKSAGDLLEWTGDAMLIQFQDNDLGTAVARAVRAGLRMQRIMDEWSSIEGPRGVIQLGMRIGIHAGTFLSADIGTPRRMEYVILGSMVQMTKHAEGYGSVGRVCLTAAAQTCLEDRFHVEPAEAAKHWLIIDDLSAEQLGEYDLQLPQRRMRGGLLMDRSEAALIQAIEEALPIVEQLAAYLPGSMLRVLIEQAAKRTLPARFIQVPIVFVNLCGLTNIVDQHTHINDRAIVDAFAIYFNVINAIVESEDGTLKNITYDKVGSTILIYFGGFYDYADGPQRAARTALSIREAVVSLAPTVIEDIEHQVYCKIGLAYGPAFIAEIGEARGRREFNILGDTVNTAARLMSGADTNQILMNQTLYTMIDHTHSVTALGERNVKGKTAALTVYSLDH